MTKALAFALAFSLPGCLGSITPHRSAIGDDKTADLESAQSISDGGVNDSSSDASLPASSSDAGGGDTRNPDLSIAAGKVPIFLAQGAVGRTTISCDDGQTWIGNRSWDSEADPIMCGMAQQATCYTGTCSYEINNQCVSMQCCNDTPDVAKGVAYNDGVFVGAWGWGQPGDVRRSTDGIHWTSTHAGDNYGGVAYGAGKFVAISRAPISSPDGTTWALDPAADFRSNGSPTGTQLWSIRRVAFADYQGGRFIGIADSDLLTSADAGQTWQRPNNFPSECFGNIMAYGDILYGNGTIVIIQESGTACRSIDGGTTWSSTSTGQTVLSRGVFTDGKFVIWGDHIRLSSPDGVNWTTTATNVRLEGAVARSAAGTYIADANLYTGYSQQTLYRSSDGVNWQELAPGAFVKSHPFFAITFGYADASACAIGQPMTITASSGPIR